MEQVPTEMSEEPERRPSSVLSFFRSHSDSPPPEPFDRHSVLDVQLINMLKQNYDIISLISDADRSESPGSKKISTGSKTDKSPSTLFLRNRAKSIAIPSLIVGNADTVRVADFNENRNKKGFMESLKDQWTDFYSDVLDALSETNEDRKEKSLQVTSSLSAYTLRRDIKRSLTEIQPYVETVAGLRDLFIWKNPISSLSVLFVYMYSIYRGWIASLFFFTILLQLTLNYFAEHKEVNFGIYFLPKKKVSLRKVDLSGVQLVFDVARKAQILLTFIADLLEKAKALPTSRDERKSKSAYEQVTVNKDVRRRSIGVIPFQSTVTPSTPPESPHTMEKNGEDADDLSALDGDRSDDMFMLTRSCVIVDKEKPFPWGMASGTIVLNEKMVGFRYQRSKDGLREILQIPFGDIIAVKKIRTMKTFSLIPGASKSLELKLTTKKKPIQFIDIPKRDEFYESIVETARIAGYELGLNDDDC
ncbi:hypothetical protein FO519_001950 [Halicephalobus sp. NKZ332]|nr:hypothetical protein FO519_001950 [Halicephalobus sp. NKZ332]